MSYIPHRSEGDLPSTAPLPLRGIPDIAPFQLLLSDYMKRKVQVVYAALDTFYLYLAEPSHLKDFYPKALYAAFLLLAHSV